MSETRTRPAQATAPDAARSPRDRSAGSLPAHLRTILRPALPALVGYALVRLIGVVAVSLRAGEDGPSLGQLLTTRFDTAFYVHIAQYGYADLRPGSCAVQGELCNYAFFPLYPGLIRGLSAALPIPVGQVAWFIAVIASLLAAWGIYAATRHVAGQRAGVIAAVLWGIVPHAMVESMAYTEPVFTALAAWALYATLTRRWVAAAVLACLAGLTRPSGSAVVAAVVLAALWSWYADRAKKSNRAVRPWQLVTAVVVAPLGWFAWFGWVGYRAGDWRGYFDLQERWGSTFDGGSFTLHRIADVFLKAPLNLNTVVGAATVITAVVLFVVCLQQRQPLVLLVYAGVLLLIAAGGAGYFHSKARFLLPAFPLLIPMAQALAKARPATMYVLLTAATLISTGYGVHLMLVWKFSP